MSRAEDNTNWDGYGSTEYRGDAASNGGHAAYDPYAAYGDSRRAYGQVPDLTTYSAPVSYEGGRRAERPYDGRATSSQYAPYEPYGADGQAGRQGVGAEPPYGYGAQSHAARVASQRRVAQTDYVVPSSDGGQGAHNAPAPVATAKKPRLASLEGLRALAILSILLYHLNVAWLPSGHMGVVMFLVLTGYLVVGSLVKSVERTGGIDLKSFWLRRFKRIWPPMVVMIVVVAALCVVFNHVLLTKMRPDILPSLLFFSNWAYIFSGASYFDAIGGPSPLTHLWYLGVDAQTIILLPIIVLISMKLAGLGRRGVRRVLLALALISAIAMAVLFDPSADPSRVYYGVDTRIFSVLLGGWLACVWPLGGSPALCRDLLVTDNYTPTSTERATVVCEGIGIGALVLLVLIMVVTPATSPFFYYGGMVLVSLFVVCLIGGLVAPGSILSKAFSLKPVVWLGSRSFALYLWHYPIIHLLGAAGNAPWWLKLIAAVVSLAVAELTCRFVEEPLADGRALTGLKDFVGALRAGELGAWFADPQGRMQMLPFAASAGAGALISLIALVGCIAVPHTTLVPEDAIKSTGDAVDQAVDLSAQAPAQEQQQSQSNLTTINFDVPYDQMTDEQKAQVQAEIQRLAAEANKEKNASVDEALATARSRIAQTGPVAVPEGSLTLYTSPEQKSAGLVEPLLIGDSVPGDTEANLVWLDGYNDSYIGRQPSQAVSVFQGYLDQNKVGNVVVFATFSNSNPVPDVYEQLVTMAGERQVFLVGVVAPDVDQNAVNTALYDCASRHENAHYIDWPTVCSQNPSGYLWGDMEHVTPRGAAAYVDMISQAIAPYMVAEGGRAEPYTWDSSWW